MISRSLFIKIFLWFWLANTLVIGTLALVIWASNEEEQRGPRMLPSRLHELQIRGAFAVREVGGQEEFARHLAILEDASAMKTFWLDETGREINGREVPKQLREFADEHRDAPTRRFERRPLERRRDGASESPWMLFPLEDPQGHRFRALAQVTRTAGGPWSVPTWEWFLRVAAIVLTAGVLCYGLARYLVSPIKRLQRTVGGLAAGDLSVHVDDRLTARRDEIGELSRDFDRMTNQVTALLTTQRRLLQDVSHELRSPLARMNVALEIAAPLAGPAANEALARVRREGDRLNELIGNLLVLARLEGGVANPERVSIDLRAMVSEIADDAEFEAGASERHVHMVRADECTLMGVSELLRSAIDNVMRNAVRHAPVGTNVEVALARSDDGAVITIRDHGRGVPDAALARIFQPFFRISDARDRASGGAGLGLAITDRAIRLHGGTVVARNAPDGGLIVEITLPC